MKLALLIVLTLILALTASGQSKSVDDIKAQAKAFKNANARRYKISYDKFESKTSVLYLGDVLNSTINYMSTGGMIDILAAFSFEDDKLSKSADEFVLAFNAEGKDWQFLRNQHLFVIADGERMDLGEGEIESDVNRKLFGGYQTTELLSFNVSRNQFEKLANAKSLELKVINREFKIKPSTQMGFKNILALSEVK
jgi:hypothetical protein